MKILCSDSAQNVPDAECLKKARKSRGLERAFKMAVDASVYDELEKEMNNLGQ